MRTALVVLATAAALIGGASAGLKVERSCDATTYAPADGSGGGIYGPSVAGSEREACDWQIVRR